MFDSKAFHINSSWNECFIQSGITLQQRSKWKQIDKLQRPKVGQNSSCGSKQTRLKLSLGFILLTTTPVILPPIIYS